MRKSLSFVIGWMFDLNSDWPRINYGIKGARAESAQMSCCRCRMSWVWTVNMRVPLIAGCGWMFVINKNSVSARRCDTMLATSATTIWSAGEFECYAAASVESKFALGITWMFARKFYLEESCNKCFIIIYFCVVLSQWVTNQSIDSKKKVDLSAPMYVSGWYGKWWCARPTNMHWIIFGVMFILAQSPARHKCIHDDGRSTSSSSGVASPLASGSLAYGVMGTPLQPNFGENCFISIYIWYNQSILI